MQLLHMASIAARSDGRFMLTAFAAPPPVLRLHYQAWQGRPNDGFVIAVVPPLKYQGASAYQRRQTRPCAR